MLIQLGLSFVLFLAPAPPIPKPVAGLIRGTVLSVCEDGFTLKTREGERITFLVSPTLKKGEVDAEMALVGFKGKFSEMRKGMEVGVDYRRTGDELVCVGLLVLKQPKNKAGPRKK